VRRGFKLPAPIVIFYVCSPGTILNNLENIDRGVSQMQLEGNCQTTAMGIMPHTDVDRALELALSLDIPFWPQLPKVNFFEDMYAQVSQHFPGIILCL